MAQLQGASLEGANLQGADLRGANLRQAKLGDVNALTIEQLSVVKNLYAVENLDEKLMKQIQENYPNLLALLPNE